MKYFYLVLLLLPLQLRAQDLSHFLGQPIDKVAKNLERQHLAHDTSFRYSDPPSVDYVAYAPYMVSGVPGVLRIKGYKTVSSIEWNSHGLGVDSDLNFVIGRNPKSTFSKVARALRKPVSQVQFNRLVTTFTKSLGKPTRSDSTSIRWLSIDSSRSESAKRYFLLAFNKGFVVFRGQFTLSVATVQPVRFDSAKSAAIKSKLSPGFRGLTLNQIEPKVKGSYEIRQASSDSSSIQFSPYRFHGIPGVLALGFDSSRICRSIYWTSHDRDWLIAHSRDTASAMYRSISSLINLRVSEQQYNSLREEIGLEPLRHPRGLSFLEYWPILQDLRYETGVLEYREEPGYRPLPEGIYLSGVEPTMDITTGH